MQQRAANKRLWPNYWSNSCCSHPRAGESMDIAVQRRCEQELGFRTPLQFVYKFEYHARFRDLGSEHELCSVYIGSFHGAPKVNTTEVQAWRWISPQDLNLQLSDEPHLFTPWFKMEWRRLCRDFADAVTLV